MNMERVSNASHLKYGGLGWGETCSSTTVTPVVGERASLEDIRAEELSLSFTSYNTHESDQCSNTVELALMALIWES